MLCHRGCNWYICFYLLVGGLLGDNYQSKVIHCYSTGKPIGTVYIYTGGLCGHKTTGSTDTGNYWDNQTSGRTTSAMGTGKTTTQMKTLSTFTGAGWDFSDTDGDGADWMMMRPGEDYPRLKWQEVIAGDIAGLYGVDMIDYTRLANHWGQTGCPADCENADINEDGEVNILDLSLLADNWLAGV